MADHHATQTAGEHPSMDYAEHEKTYRMFIGLTKWGAILSVAVLVFMAITLL